MLKKTISAILIAVLITSLLTVNVFAFTMEVNGIEIDTDVTVNGNETVIVMKNVEFLGDGMVLVFQEIAQYGSDNGGKGISEQIKTRSYEILIYKENVLALNYTVTVNGVYYQGDHYSELTSISVTNNGGTMASNTSYYTSINQNRGSITFIIDESVIYTEEYVILSNGNIQKLALQRSGILVNIKNPDFSGFFFAPILRRFLF